MSGRTQTATLFPPVPAQSGESATSDGLESDSMPDLVAAEPPGAQSPPSTRVAAHPIRRPPASKPADVRGADQIEKPFWNPRSGVFDGARLRLAIVMRGWTVREFAKVCKISLACLYNILNGDGATDRIAIRIFEGLRQRQPLPPIPEVANAR
jgi:hypothetical protein